MARSRKILSPCRRAMRRVDAALEAIQEAALPLLLYGELTDPDVDLFDREAVFIERFLVPLLQRHAGSMVVLEHIITRQAAEFVVAAPPNVSLIIAEHRAKLITGQVKAD